MSGSPTPAAAPASSSSTPKSIAMSTTRKRATYGRNLDKYGFIMECASCESPKKCTCNAAPDDVTPDHHQQKQKPTNGKKKGGSNVSKHGSEGGDGGTESVASETAVAAGPDPAATTSTRSTGNRPPKSTTTTTLSARREEKWSKMISDWDRTTHKRKKKLQRRIRKGVPNSVRGAVWTKLAEVPRRIDVTDCGKYEELVRISGEAEQAEQVAAAADDGSGSGNDEEKAKIIEQASDRNRATPRATRETIERDINRTFPRHYLFADSSDDESSDDDDDDDEGGGMGENGDNNSDLQAKRSDDKDNSGVPVWSKKHGVDAATAAAVLNAVEANLEGGTDLVAELDAVLGPVGDGAAAAARETRRSSITRKDQVPDRISNAVIPAHRDVPVTIRKKLFHAMQQCNANLEQVDLAGLDMTEDGVVPTSFLVPTPASSKDKDESGPSAESSNKSTPTATSDGKNPRKLTRKLTREEKREIRKADYAGAKGGQASLRRVLRAYSVYDPSVGYCQGMNFIAAMFITITHQEEEGGDSVVSIKRQEEEAFWLLVTVMNEAPFQCRELFGEGMSGAHRVLHVAEKLIGQFLPKLSKHLEKENIHITMFATQWLLTLYTSSFPFELVTRVWDCFLSEGWKIVYRVMLAILDRASPDLMKLHFEEILGYFRDLPSKVDGDAIFAKVFDIPLKRRHIQKYEAEWTAQQQSRSSS